MTMTLEQFRATRREVADLTTENIGVEPDEFGGVKPGYLYTYRDADDNALFYIEKHGNDQVFLILMNEDWLEPADKLPELEAILYEYAHGECEPQPIQIPPPTTLSELFAMSLGHPATETHVLDEVPLDSVCGRDCAAAIAAGTALRVQTYKALGDDLTAEIAGIVERTCVVFIRG